MGGETGVFFKCLAKGKIGEQMLLAKFPHLADNTLDDEREPDVVSINGKLVEVKYDASVRARRDHNGYQLNILFERYKNVGTRSPGGPWWCVDKNCEFFVVIFMKPEQYYYFRTIELVGRLETLIRQERMREFGRFNTFKKNKCYLCPKTLISDLMLSEEEFVRLTQNVE